MVSKREQIFPLAISKGTKIWIINRKGPLKGISRKMVHSLSGKLGIGNEIGSEVDMEKNEFHSSLIPL